MVRNNRGQFTKGPRPEKRKGKFINCNICGKEKYVMRKYLLKGFGKYCSSKCAGKAFSKQRKGKGLTGIYIECSLLNCTKKKYFPLAVSKLPTKKYCSHEHKNLSRKGIAPPNKGKPGLRGKDSFHWLGGKPKCLDCGKICSTYGVLRCRKCNDKSEYFKSKAVNGRIVQQFMKGPTSIEKILYDYLKSKQIIFKKQYKIEFYLVDAYIPKLNLIIEVDGEYWHSLPERIRLDKAKNTYLLNRNYNLIRLPEQDMKNGQFIVNLKNVGIF